MRRLLTLCLCLALLFPSLALAEMLTVVKDKVNFRKEPSTKATVAFTANRYYPVQVVKRQGTWCQVKDFEGETAWIHSGLLARTRGVIVKATKANIRKSASSQAPVVFVANQGAAFKLLKIQGPWLYVEHADGDKGWVSKNLVWGL